MELKGEILNQEYQDLKSEHNILRRQTIIPNGFRFPLDDAPMRLSDWRLETPKNSEVSTNTSYEKPIAFELSDRNIVFNEPA